MATSRERATIDLRGLGPALKANARARNLSVSDVTRLAVAELLKTEGSDSGEGASASPGIAGDGRVKLTLRLRQGVAARLNIRAHASGLSRSAYLTTLIEGAPAPPLALGKALGASTEQLAVVSGDLNELIRTIGNSAISSDLPVKEWLHPLLEEVRQHIGVASRLMFEMRATRRNSAPEGVRGVGHGSRP